MRSFHNKDSWAKMVTWRMFLYGRFKRKVLKCEMSRNICPVQYLFPLEYTLQKCFLFHSMKELCLKNMFFVFTVFWRELSPKKVACSKHRPFPIIVLFSRGCTLSEINKHYFSKRGQTYQKRFFFHPAFERKLSTRTEAFSNYTHILLVHCAVFPLYNNIYQLNVELCIRAWRSKIFKTYGRSFFFTREYDETKKSPVGDVFPPTNLVFDLHPFSKRNLVPQQKYFQNIKRFFFSRWYFLSPKKCFSSVLKKKPSKTTEVFSEHRHVLLLC